MANTKIREGECPKESGLPGRTGSQVGLSQIHTCPYTGDQYTIGKGGWRRPVKWSDLELRYPVAGLVAELSAPLITWTWRREEPIDEADARDAQCRAGWSDIGYGFYGFEVSGNVATWKSGASCD